MYMDKASRFNSERNRDHLANLLDEMEECEVCQSSEEHDCPEHGPQEAL